MTHLTDTEDQLVDQPAIGLCAQRLPLCKRRLHHPPPSPTTGWYFWGSATSQAGEARHD